MTPVPTGEGRSIPSKPARSLSHRDTAVSLSRHRRVSPRPYTLHVHGTGSDNAALAVLPAAAAWAPPGAGVRRARAPRGAAGPGCRPVGARPPRGARRRRGGQGAPEGRGDRRPGAEPVRLHQVARQAGGHAAQRWGVPTAESAACSSGPFRASPQGAFLIPFSLPRHCRCFVFPTVFVGRFRFPSIFEFLWTYTSNFRQIPLLVFSAFSPDNFTMFSTCLH